MTNFIHKNTAAKWQAISLAEQLANVGSEYGRALKWKEKGNEKLFWSALERMLELLDLTIADQRWHDGKLKELTRLREMICISLLDERSDIYQSDKDFSQYFLQFNLLVRS